MIRCLVDKEVKEDRIREHLLERGMILWVLVMDHSVEVEDDHLTHLVVSVATTSSRS
jgi:hypothetical protein